MQRHHIQTMAVCGALLLLAAFSWYHDTHTPYIEAETIGKGAASFSELSDRFAALANAKGAVYAFDVLKLAQLPPNTDLHLLGHVIGDILYKQQGVAGMQYCTQDFRNACSHTIAIGAFNEYGPAGALPLIRDACHKAPGGSGAYTMCYHGLGHGVFAYFGYDLSKAVAVCKQTGTAAYGMQEYTQCVGGAIMELVGGGGHNHDAWVVAQKKYFTNDPLSPCMGSIIPEAAKTMCLIYLTPRLFTLAGADLAHPDPSTFPKAFSYCDAIPTTKQNLRDACYGGFGKEFIVLSGGRDIRAVSAYSDQQFEAALNWCALAGAKDGEKACVKNEVSSVFWGGENDPDASFRFCSLAQGDTQNACYAGLAGEIQQYMSGERRTGLCDRLPSPYNTTCARGLSSASDAPSVANANRP